MSQRVSRGSWPGGLRPNTEDYRDLLRGDLDLLNQCPNDIPPEMPVGVGQPGTHLAGELVQTPDQQLQIALGILLIGVLMCLLLQGRKARAQPSQARRELLLAEQ